jgi:hypothetical protein
MNRLQVIGALVVLATSSAELTKAKPTTEIVANTKPSVVTIETFDVNSRPLGQGTGFFIASRIVVTNAHVIKDAAYINVTDLLGKHYTFFDVIATSDNPDLALVDVGAMENHPFLSLDSSDAPEGENVLVIGSPEGFQGTVTTGIISSVRSTDEMYQISAPISPGSSGSPVLNEDGKAIAVVVGFWMEGQNLNFAIQSSQVLQIWNAALQNPMSGRAFPKDIAMMPPAAPQTQIAAYKTPTASNDPARREITSLIYNYLIATQTGKPTTLVPFCTTQLAEWYGRQKITMEEAEKDIADYYRTWPTQTLRFDIKDLNIEPIAGRPDKYVASIPFLWYAANGKRTSTGKSELQAVVVLTSNGYGYRISAIRNVKLN